MNSVIKQYGGRGEFKKKTKLKLDAALWISKERKSLSCSKQSPGGGDKGSQTVITSTCSVDEAPRRNIAVNNWNEKEN